VNHHIIRNIVNKMISYLIFLTEALAFNNNHQNPRRMLYGHGYGRGMMVHPGMMGGGMYGHHPMMNSSHGSMMNSHGSNMLNSGNYNRGSNYSNRNAWDKGYSNTDANSYNHGGYMNSAGNHGLMNSNMSNMGFLRRLNTLSEPVVYDGVEELPLEEVEIEDPGLDDSDQEIDGQSFVLGRGGLLDTIASYASPYMGGGYQQGAYPMYNTHGGYPNMGVNDRYAMQPMMGSNGYGRQNQSMNQGVQQGHYNAGDVYQNQSGWDRGYNNTNARSNRRGGSDHQYRSGMHQNQMGYYQNQYGGGMYR